MRPASLATVLVGLVSVMAVNVIHLEKYHVSVTLPDSLKTGDLMTFHPFTDWLETLSGSLAQQARDPKHPFHHDPYHLKSITIQSFDMFGPRLGFLKFRANVSTADNGRKLPGVTFMRGPGVAMLVMLVPDDAPTGSDERYVLMVVQPRVPAGSLGSVELPAGMVDDAGDFVGTAAREIHEECGLTVRQEELTDLTLLAKEAGAYRDTQHGEKLEYAMYPSPGGSDETIRIFSWEKRMPRAELEKLDKKLSGLRDHGEMITLKLVRMQDLWKEATRDAKALTAIVLWENLRREGRV